MTTQAQAEANRRNAQKSTGPRTPEGKAASRVNGVRHGLRCEKVLVTDEDPAAYLEHRRGMLRRLQPADALEERVADRVISLSWRLKRADWLEAAYMNRDLGRARHIAQHEVPKEQQIAWDEEPDSCLVGLVLGEAMSGPANSYETLRRYERTAERGLYAALREWRTLRKERRGDAGKGDAGNCGFRIADCGLKTGAPDDVATAQASTPSRQCEVVTPGLDKPQSPVGNDGAAVHAVTPPAPSPNPKSEIRNPQSPLVQDDAEGDPGSPQEAPGPNDEESCRANPIWDPASNTRNSCYQGLFRRAAENAAARERSQRSQSGRRRKRGRHYPHLDYRSVEPDPDEFRQWWEEMEEDQRDGKPVVDFCVWKAALEAKRSSSQGRISREAGDEGRRGDAERGDAVRGEGDETGEEKKGEGTPGAECSTPNVQGEEPGDKAATSGEAPSAL